jgi:adenine-specific DNA methylase
MSQILRGPKGNKFVLPEREDIEALAAAERELAKLRPNWERRNVIPTENYPLVTSDERPIQYGMPRWADMFSPRQLLGFGTLVEELHKLRREIELNEGKELGEAVLHLLTFGFEKFANWNAILASWNAPFATARSVFDRHDFSFKATFCEMAACTAGSDWNGRSKTALARTKSSRNFLARLLRCLPRLASGRLRVFRTSAIRASRPWSSIRLTQTTFTTRSLPTFFTYG